MTETRLGYLCYKAARNRLSSSERKELDYYQIIQPNLQAIVALEMALIDLSAQRALNAVINEG